MPGKLADLLKFGQSPWYDNIARKLLLSGELKQMIDKDGITGLTSNPSIFEKAINGSSEYDDQIRELLKHKKSVFEIYDELTVSDIIAASNLLLPVYESTAGADGYVSLEVSPRLAHNSGQTIEEARRLFKKVNKKNLMIKVPATEEGFIAIHELISEGININITLIFSEEHYRNAAQAYIDGLRKRLGAGHDVRRLYSVASFFVSRIDTYIDRMLDKKIEEESNPRKKDEIKLLKGKAAVAQCKKIYTIYKRIFEGREFEPLHGRGARVQRLLFGSTSTKNPEYSDVKYVEEIIGDGTINTIPHSTILAFRDHGVAQNTINDRLEEATLHLNKLDNIGIDISKVCQRIQDDGVKSFKEAFETLLNSLEQKSRLFA